MSARQNAPNLALEGDMVAGGDALDQVKAALIKTPADSEEKWLYCESQAKAATASQMKPGRTLHYQSITKVEGKQQEICNTLNLSTQILQARKTIV